MTIQQQKKTEKTLRTSIDSHTHGMLIKKNNKNEIKKVIGPIVKNSSLFFFCFVFDCVSFFSSHLRFFFSIQKYNSPIIFLFIILFFLCFVFCIGFLSFSFFLLLSLLLLLSPLLSSTSWKIRLPFYLLLLLMLLITCVNYICVQQKKHRTKKRWNENVNAVVPCPVNSHHQVMEQFCFFPFLEN